MVCVSCAFENNRLWYVECGLFLMLDASLLRSFYLLFSCSSGITSCLTFVSIPWHYSISYLYRSVLLCYDIHYCAGIMFLPQLRTCVIGAQGYLHPKLMYLFVCMCVGTYMCMYVYICVYTYIYIHACVCACVRARACVCVCRQGSDTLLKICLPDKYFDHQSWKGSLFSCALL
jgi:succinate dehydrogenase/fumarate reductase cytochrome b subunit